MKLDSSAQAELKAESPGRSDWKPVALLCATPYDDITRFLSTLFDDFPNLGIVTKVIKIERAVSYKELVDSLVLDDTTETILVFSGHGADDALLGPPHLDNSGAVTGAKHSCFYDETFFDSGPSVLLAFCCSSGAVLGESFRTDPLRAFMGFDSPIGFVTAGGVYLERWKRILHRSTLKIIYARDAKELEDDVRKLYMDAYHYFKSLEGQQNEWWFWMTLLLRGQLDALRVHGRRQEIPEEWQKAAYANMLK
jgi:hypothetical protein